MSSISPSQRVKKAVDFDEDVFNAISIRMSSIGSRPIWNINFSVDQVSFYIGAVGGVSLGYMLNQYEPPNIDNINYVNEQSDDGPNIFGSLIRNTLTSPFKIIQRFFVSGTSLSDLLQVGCYGREVGEDPSHVEHLLVSTSHMGVRRLITICPFSQMLKATAGFGMFALVMEGLFYLS